MIVEEIELAINTLKKGDLVAIPTETVYGLAANALNVAAVKRIFELKNRPSNNPLIVHVASWDAAQKYVQEVPAMATELAYRFMPGPLTLLLQKNVLVPDLVTAGSAKVAIRVPEHSKTLSLLKSLDFPLVAPSANPYTRISPTSAQMVEAYFGKDELMVLDGGHCEKGIESTIVGFDGTSPVLYRQGAISIEAIEKVVGPLKMFKSGQNATITPGMAKLHYAPKTKFLIVANIEAYLKAHPQSKLGVLQMGATILHEAHSAVQFKQLSLSSNLEEASAKLYQAMYELDMLGLDAIIIEPFQDLGIGKALNDRIQRAAFV